LLTIRNKTPVFIFEDERWRVMVKGRNGESVRRLYLKVKSSENAVFLSISQKAKLIPKEYL
jgi:hypothetical protein